MADNKPKKVDLAVNPLWVIGGGAALALALAAIPAIPRRNPAGRDAIFFAAGVAATGLFFWGGDAANRIRSVQSNNESATTPPAPLPGDGSIARLMWQDFDQIVVRRFR
jgi:hypothetical protein